MKLKELADLLQVPTQRIKDLKKAQVFVPENRSNKGRPLNYTENDLKELRRIILLNKCGISSREIKEIDSGKISLSEQLDKKSESLKKQMKQIEGSLALMLPVRANSEALDTNLTEMLYTQSVRMAREGMEFYEPEEYSWDGYNPFIQKIHCPTCHMGQNFDLEEFETASSLNECPMGFDRVIEIETEPDSLECKYCGTRFGVKGWTREYPLGAYDSSELTTILEETNE